METILHHLMLKHIVIMCLSLDPLVHPKMNIGVWRTEMFFDEWKQSCTTSARDNIDSRAHEGETSSAFTFAHARPSSQRYVLVVQDCFHQPVQ